MDKIIDSILSINKNLLAMYKKLDITNNKNDLLSLMNDELKKESKILDSLTMYKNMYSLVSYLSDHNVILNNPILTKLSNKDKFLILTKIKRSVTRIIDFINIEDNKYDVNINDIDKCIISKPLNILEKRNENLETIKRYIDLEIINRLKGEYKKDIGYILLSDFRNTTDLKLNEINKDKISIILKDPYIINVLVNKFIQNDYRNLTGFTISLEEKIIDNIEADIILEIIPDEYLEFLNNRVKIYDIDDKNPRNINYKLTEVNDIIEGLFSSNPKQQEEHFNNQYKIEEIIHFENEFKELRLLSIPMYKLIKEMTFIEDNNKKNKLYKEFKNKITKEDLLISKIKDKQGLAEYLDKMIIQNKVGNNLSFILSNLSNLQNRSTHDDSYLTSVVEEIYTRRIINKLYKSHGIKPVRANINNKLIESVLDLKDLELFFSKPIVQRLSELKDRDEIDLNDYVNEMKKLLGEHYHTHRVKEIDRIEARSILSYNMIHLIANDINNPNVDKNTKDFLLFTKNLIIFLNDLESYYKSYNNNLDNYDISYNENDFDEKMLNLYQSEIDKELKKLEETNETSYFYKYFKSKYEKGSYLLRKKRKEHGNN